MPAQDAAAQTKFRIKEPRGLSPRIQWLRDYFFQGLERPWNNEFRCWTTGTPWDVLYEEANFYIVPESYAFFTAMRASMLQAARPVPLPDDPRVRNLIVKPHDLKTYDELKEERDHDPSTE